MSRPRGRPVGSGPGPRYERRKVQLTPGQWESLRDVAEHLQVSVAAVVRLAVASYLASPSAPSRHQ